MFQIVAIFRRYISQGSVAMHLS